MKMKKIKIIIVILISFPSTVFAQNYLTQEQEQSIKLSGRYYWDEGNDFNDVKAYQIALNNLTERIIRDAVYQTKKREEVLKELEMKAQTGRIQQEGMACVLAWIAKDSVFVTTQRPLNSLQASSRPEETPKVPVVVTQQPNEINNSKNETPPSTKPIAVSQTSANHKVDDPVLHELLNCKNYKEVNKVANRRGLVRGDINSADGFDKPELCYIAVFDFDGALVALLDKGDTSRVDVLSGNTIQNPRNYYRNKGYNLLYLQRK